MAVVLEAFKTIAVQGENSGKCWPRYINIAAGATQLYPDSSNQTITIDATGTGSTKDRKVILVPHSNGSAGDKGQR